MSVTSPPSFHPRLSLIDQKALFEVLEMADNSLICPIPQRVWSRSIERLLADHTGSAANPPGRCMLMEIPTEIRLAIYKRVDPRREMRQTLTYEYRGKRSDRSEWCRKTSRLTPLWNLASTSSTIFEECCKFNLIVPVFYLDVPSKAYRWVPGPYTHRLPGPDTHRLPSDSARWLRCLDIEITWGAGGGRFLQALMQSMHDGALLGEFTIAFNFECQRSQVNGSQTLQPPNLAAPQWVTPVSLQVSAASALHVGAQGIPPPAPPGATGIDPAQLMLFNPAQQAVPPQLIVPRSLFCEDVWKIRKMWPTLKCLCRIRIRCDNLHHAAVDQFHRLLKRKFDLLNL